MPFTLCERDAITDPIDHAVTDAIGYAHALTVDDTLRDVFSHAKRDSLAQCDLNAYSDAYADAFSDAFAHALAFQFHLHARAGLPGAHRGAFDGAPAPAGGAADRGWSWSDEPVPDAG